MSALRELQLKFSQDVFSGGETGFAAQIEANRLGGDRRLQVYRNNTYLNFTEVLQGTYPVVQRLVGIGFFRYAAHHYITQFPSISGDLHEFGATFPQFLNTFEPARQLPYLPDVAHLEWSYQQVFYAAEHPPLNPTALTGLFEARYGDLKFKLNPGNRLLASAYPVRRIWEVNQPGYDGEQVVDLSTGGNKLLVFRNATLDVEMQSLREGEFTLLQTLADGQDFATACEQALTREPDFDVPGNFRHHIVQGTLVDCWL